MALTVKYIFPLGLVIFAVTGLIILGVATASEAAAVGALVCFILAFFYRGFRGDILKKSIVNSVKITVMMFMILSGASAFSQLLAYTGATQNLVQLAIGLPLSPMLFLSSCNLS
jgi:TRAP-type mannitol/chloroaromatic compound transport system permease large subunit